MNKRIISKGFCPMQNKNYSIEVDYLDASTLNESLYVKGTYRCQHNIYADKCVEKECPIYQSVPDNI